MFRIYSIQKHDINVMKLLQLLNARFLHNGVLILYYLVTLLFWLCVAQES